MTAFGERNMMRSSLTQWLTAGRFMRGLYGYAKGLGFVFLTGEVGFKHATSGFMADLYDNDLFRFVGWSIVWLAVALLVIRGLPVVFDALPYMNRKPLSNAAAGRAPVAPPAEPSTPARGGH
jgi:CDP-diacylglycerol--glycerol-3-phosphate 3-phosphatidyltransferase